ncbi:MAG: hydrogen peroxide-inducible genes activator [Bacteriovorax sp.]|jgi:LysR family hydrogen peroxide-inducible transcriptional activator
MTITQLEYVLAVFQKRNFVEAAKFCSVSQPTLSMQLKKLEEEIGYVIFDRSKMPVIVTEEGGLFIEQAKKVILEFKKLYQRDEKELKGELIIGIIPTIASDLIPLFLPRFLADFPMISIRFEELKTEEIIEKLKRDEIHAGILATPLKESSFIEKVLYYEPFVPYISGSHKLSKKSTIDPGEIDGENLWLLEEGHCLRTQILKLCSARRSHSLPVFTGGNIETLMRLVDENLGMTILPFLALKHAKTKNIRKFSHEVPVREVSIVTARNFYKENLIGALETSILNSLPDDLDIPKRRKIHILKPLS